MSPVGGKIVLYPCGDVKSKVGKKMDLQRWSQHKGGSVKDGATPSSLQ